MTENGLPDGAHVPTMNGDRRGDWMETFTGRKFWPLDPRPDEVCIADIAHALANTCRFGGHVREFYSVAQHSVIVSRHVPEEYAVLGLLHDAAEAYLGDVITPLKRAMPVYSDTERQLLSVLMRGLWPRPGGALGVSGAACDTVKHVDTRLLWAEAQQLMANGTRDWRAWANGYWAAGVEPLDVRIIPWCPTVAETMFLERWEEVSA